MGKCSAGKVQRATPHISFLGNHSKIGQQREVSKKSGFVTSNKNLTAIGQSSCLSCVTNFDPGAPTVDYGPSFGSGCTSGICGCARVGNHKTNLVFISDQKLIFSLGGSSRYCQIYTIFGPSNISASVLISDLGISQERQQDNIDGGDADKIGDAAVANCALADALLFSESLVDKYAKFWHAALYHCNLACKKPIVSVSQNTKTSFTKQEESYFAKHFRKHVFLVS